jgi:hypothetical protein
VPQSLLCEVSVILLARFQRRDGKPPGRPEKNAIKNQKRARDDGARSIHTIARGYGCW